MLHCICFISSGSSSGSSSSSRSSSSGSSSSGSRSSSSGSSSGSSRSSSGSSSSSSGKKFLNFFPFDAWIFFTKFIVEVKVEVTGNSNVLVKPDFRALSICQNWLTRPDQFISKWYARQWQALVKITRKDIFHFQYDQFPLLESTLRLSLHQTVINFWLTGLEIAARRQRALWLHLLETFHCRNMKSLLCCSNHFISDNKAAKKHFWNFWKHFKMSRKSRKRFGKLKGAARVEKENSWMTNFFTHLFKHDTTKLEFKDIQNLYQNCSKNKLAHDTSARELLALGYGLLLWMIFLFLVFMRGWGGGVSLPPPNFSLPQQPGVQTANLTSKITKITNGPIISRLLLLTKFALFFMKKIASLQHPVLWNALPHGLLVSS